MSVEWTSTDLPRAEVRREHSATVQGLRIEVREELALGISWSVIGYLDDFNLHAFKYGGAVRIVEEAKAAAVAAARRLLELGARGTR